MAGIEERLGAPCAGTVARRGMAWAIAGAVALAVQYLVPGWWFIVAGSIAVIMAIVFDGLLLLTRKLLAPWERKRVAA